MCVHMYFPGTLYTVIASIIMCVHMYFTGTLYTVVASIIGGLASAVVLYQLYSRIQIFVTIMRTVR
jgi:hypothetical protein